MSESTPIFGEVYVHTCTVNGKSYVGQTTVGVSKRWAEHVRHSRLAKCADFRYPFSRAVRKYSPESFESQVLAVASSKAELDNLEKIWILLLQTRETGYNLGTGGEGNPGLSHTAKTKAKISQNRAGKGLGNKNAVGTVRSEEQKKKDRLQNIGKKFSAEHNDRIRIARTGVKRPDVTAANNRRWAAVRAAKAVQHGS